MCLAVWHNADSDLRWDQLVDDDRTVLLADRVMTRQVGGETVLLNLDTETYFGLDEIGTDILEILRGGATVEEAVAELVNRWDVSRETLRSDVCELVDGLVEHGLAEWDHQSGG